MFIFRHNGNKKLILLQAFILLLLFSIDVDSLSAQDAFHRLRISYTHHLLTLSAVNTDIKTVLSELAEKTGIHIVYPASMNEQITVEKRGVPLLEVLQSLLRNFNHAIIYSSADGTGSEITKVLIYTRSKGSNLSALAERQLQNRIRLYRNRIRELTKRLSRLDANSSRGRLYQRQIEHFQQEVQTLENRL